MTKNKRSTHYILAYVLALMTFVFLGAMTVSAANAQNSLENAKVRLSASSYTYSGTAKKPKVTVILNGKTLTLGKHYSVKYTDNVNVGTAKVTVTGMGKYSGKKTVTFSIKAQSLKEAVITLSKKIYAYDGKVKRPKVTVVLGKKTLEQGTDYTVQYSNNRKPGTAEVVITGIGNYADTASAAFTITLEKPEITLKSTRNGELKATSSEVAGAAGYRIEYRKKGETAWTRIKAESGSFQIDDLKPGAVYEARVRAYAKTADGSTLWEPLGALKTIQIFKGTKNLKDAVLKLKEPDAVWKYTGQEIRPAIVVTYGGTKLKETTHYRALYKNNVNAGTATIVVKGAGNYYGELSLTFKIGKLALKDLEVELASTKVIYTSLEIRPKVQAKAIGRTLKADTDVTLEFRNNVSVGEASVTITGIGNYKGTLKKTFTIVPLDLSKCSVTLPGRPSRFFRDHAMKAVVEVSYKGVKLEPGADTYQLKHANYSSPGVASVTVTGNGNLTGTKVLTYKLYRVFAQQDPRWKDTPYGYNDEEMTVQGYIGKGGSSDVGAGCAILSTTNALWYLKGLKDDPTDFVLELTAFSLRYGFRANGAGTVEGLTMAFCGARGGEYGIRYVKSAKTLGEITGDLENGKVAVAHVKGHYIAIVDYDSVREEYLVLDSSMKADRETVPDGYRWMKAEEFTGLMKIINSTRSLQVFGEAE